MPGQGAVELLQSRFRLPDPPAALGEARLRKECEEGGRLLDEPVHVHPVALLHQVVGEGGFAVEVDPGA